MSFCWPKLQIEMKKLIDRLVLADDSDNYLTTTNDYAIERVLLTLLSNEAVIQTLQNSLVNQYDLTVAKTLRKNSKQAELARSEGNQHYARRGDNNKAISRYNDSIRNYDVGCQQDDCSKCNNRCGYDSNSCIKWKEGLAKAYANRSAVFLNNNACEDCLLDIEVSLSLPYPRQLRHKLLKRRADCFLKLMKWHDAVAALEEAVDAIEMSSGSLSDIEAKNVAEHLKELIAKTKPKIRANENQSDKEEMHNAAEYETKGNKDLMSVYKNGIELCHTSAAGRHYIAKTALKSGSTVISERPFASVLLPEFYATHCYHCLSKVERILPCCNCNVISYCSVKCRLDSWERYHSMECMDLLLVNKTGILHLALRIVLTTSISDSYDKHFSVVSQSIDEPCAVQEASETGYTAIYNLLSHASEASREKIIEYGLDSLLLLFVLQRAKYFEKPWVKKLEATLAVNYSKCKGISEKFQHVKERVYTNLSYSQLFIASILCQHMHQMACNAIAITGLADCGIDNSSAVVEYQQKRVGTAVYPMSSMLNHSCDPTCVLTFNGNIIKVKLAKNVNAGDEISICYGPHYKKMKFKDQRINSLKSQYYFQCTCPPCENEIGHNDVSNAYKCLHCEAALDKNATECQSCSRPFDLKHYESLHESSIVHLRRSQDPSLMGKPDLVLQHLFKCLETQSQILHKYHREIGSLHNEIASCLAKQEKYSSSMLHFEKSLEVTERVHGEKSTEVGYGLLTMSDLMIKVILGDISKCNESRAPPNFEQVEKCHSVVKKAIGILGELCSDNSEELNDLREKENFLAGLLRQR
eukprot:gene17349-19082_t